jgi:hypothetical protein
MPPPTAATFRDPAGAGSNRVSLMLLGVLSMVAVALIMAVGTSLGMLYAVVAIVAVFALLMVVLAPVFGIVIFIGTLLLGLPAFLAGDGRLTANNMLGLVLLAVLAVHVCLSRDLWFVKTPPVILFALIGAAFIASLMHARLVYVPLVPPPKDFTENTLFIFFSRLVFLCMFVNFVKSRKQALLIMFAVLVFTMSVIPGAFYSFATYNAQEDVATGKMIDAETGKATEFRVQSEATSWSRNENRLAFMCNVSILLIWMFMHIWRRWFVWLLGFPLMILMTGMTLSTASRSGFLSLGLLFAFLLFQKGIPTSARMGALGAMVFAGVVFIAVLPRTSYERLLNYSLDQSTRTEAWRSTQSRIETNQHALEVFLGAPVLGIGPGNFRWIHRERYPYDLSSGRPNHNSYLWAATEGGGLSLVLYLILFAYIWRDLRRAQRFYPMGDPLWHMTRFLRGFFVIWIFFSMFADFWLEVHIYLIAGFTMLLVNRRLEARAPVAVRSASPVPPPAPAPPLPAPGAAG